MPPGTLQRVVQLSLERDRYGRTRSLKSVAQAVGLPAGAVGAFLAERRRLARKARRAGEAADRARLPRPLYRRGDDGGTPVPNPTRGRDVMPAKPTIYAAHTLPDNCVDPDYLEALRDGRSFASEDVPPDPAE